MKISKRLLAGLPVVALFAFAVPARAAVPLELTQQGRLLKTDGTAETGSITMTFALYAAATGGTALWTETQSITLDDGYFSTELGAVSPLTAALFDGQTKFLGITIQGEEEMTPREIVTSSPYAIVAGDVNGDIHPTSITINGSPVINDKGQWVGPVTGLAGTPGPTGPAGAQGPVGPTGAQGPTGSQGPAGAPGSQGPAGPLGPQGPAGAAGAAGKAGATGGVGPVGPTGIQGPTGPQGAAGSQGPAGPQGPAGSQGPAGPQGPAGAVGAQGLQGATGIVAYTTFAATPLRLNQSTTAPMFIGGKTVTVTANQSVIGSIVLNGKSIGDTVMTYGLCYQAAGGSVTFLGASSSLAMLDGQPTSANASGAGVLAAAGTYTIGWCGQSSAASSFSGSLSGWAVVTN